MGCDHALAASALYPLLKFNSATDKSKRKNSHSQHVYGSESEHHEQREPRAGQVCPNPLGRSSDAHRELHLIDARAWQRIRKVSWDEFASQHPSGRG